MSIPIPDWASIASRRLEVLLSHGDWSRCHQLIESLRKDRGGQPQMTVDQWMDEPLSDVPMVSLRVVNLLERFLGVVTVRDLIDRWRVRPIRLRQFGIRYREELVRGLREIGIDVDELVGRPVMDEGNGEMNSEATVPAEVLR